MSQRRSTAPQSGPVNLARVGAAATRAGLFAVAVTVPIAVGTAVGLAADAGNLGSVLAATGGPVLRGAGQTYLFRVAATGLLGGGWLVGAGLVLDGLFD
jgi:hypothetical protein